MAVVEARDAPPAHLLVKINTFSSLAKCGVNKYETREFDAGNYKWRLVIYPNGHGDQEGGNFVSVFLAISGTDSLPRNWEVNAVFSICIFNHISDKYVYMTFGKARRFLALNTEWGFPKYISKEVLTTPANGFLTDDSCLFGAEVFVNDINKVVTECLLVKDDIVSYKHAFKVSDFSTLIDEWCSEEFTAGGYTWQIELNPDGQAEEAGHNLSIYLMFVSTCDERVNARFTICLKNQLDSGKSCKWTASNWFEASSSPWGFPTFMSTAQLNAANAGFIVNDTCLLEIEICVQAVAAH